ncbi:MAG: hypothetical protein EOP47_20065, partial [Sphingobacteriaceae bacterium]
MTIFSAFAQKNIAPLATITATGTGAAGCQTGACSTLNDLNFGTCGTQQVWISTAGPPSTTVGADYIQWDFPSPKRFNKLVIHHAQTTARFLNGALIQYWNGSAWVSHSSFSNLPLNCSNTVSFNAISASRFRITKFETSTVGQTSNPNFREIEIIEAPGGYNNAGVQAITPATFCAGTQSLSARIENAGRNKIDSVRINWSVDGVLQSTKYYTTAVDTAGSKSGNEASISLGSLSFSSGVFKTIKVWTSFPNGKKDTMPANDTIVMKLAPALGGNYTIDPSGTGTSNFTSFTAAATALTNQGVCSAVSFTVAAKSFNESITLGNINGASLTNTITFTGAGKAATRLYSSNTNVVSLNSASYIAFKNMTIEQTSNVTTRYCVNLNSCTFITLENCAILSPFTTSVNYNLYANNCSNNIYKNNIIKGGYYAAYNYQYSTTYAYGGDLWEGNRISQSYYYGLYTYGGLDNAYLRNTIDSAGYYNIYSYYEGSAYYDGNILPGNSGPGQTPYYLILMYYPNYFGGSGYFEFYNNMLGSENTVAYYGHYLYTSGYNNIKYKHNTIHKGNSTGYNLYFYATNTTNNVELMNNNFTRTSAGSLLYYYQPNNTHKVDGNNFYPASGSALIYYNLKTFSSLADYRAEANKLGNALNTTSVMPTYKSATDLHIDQTKPAPNVKYAGVNKDVDGDDRCKLFVTAGADESQYGKTAISKAGFSGPDTVFVGSPTNYFNIASVTDPNNYAYYVNGTFVKDSIHLNLIASNTGSISIKLVTESCAGKDSLTRTIQVVNPTAKPNTRFLADKSNIMQGEIVRFTDISRNGASSWKWDVSPDSTYDGATKIARYKYLYGTSSSTQNPVIQFIVPGKYKVCLTAANNLGSNTLCRTDYITVQTAISIAANLQTITDASAYIFDNGGKDGDYTNSFKGSLLIAPCAEEIYLVFKKFDLECGYDYLRVFDGSDNKGKPLHCTSNILGVNGPGFTGGSLVCASSSTTCMPAATDTFVAKSGKMFIEMTTDTKSPLPGFEAYYWSKPKAQPKPTASFTTMSDSVCINKPLSFTNTSTGDDIKYFWDLDNDLTTFESTTKNAIWPYYATGT